MARSSGPANLAPPAWSGKRLVTPVDGPLVGRWYWAAAWIEDRKRALAYLERTGVRFTVLDYVPCKPARQVPHPTYLDATGDALEYHPPA